MAVTYLRYFPGICLEDSRKTAINLRLFNPCNETQPLTFEHDEALITRSRVSTRAANCTNQSRHRFLFPLSLVPPITPIPFFTRYTKPAKEQPQLVQC
jgi:hypothetical protein